MARFFLAIAFLLLPMNSFSLTFSDNFSTLTYIDTSNSTLTAVTSENNVRLPFISSFTDISYTGTTGLTSLFGTNGHFTFITHGNGVFLVAGAGQRIASYNGNTFTDRIYDFSGTTTYTKAIYTNNIFYVVGYSNFAGRVGFARYSITPADYLDCSYFLNSFDSTNASAIDSNDSYWLIGGNNGNLNRWNGCVSSTCATSLSNGVQTGGGFGGSDTINTIAHNSSFWLIGGTNGKLAKYDGTTFTDLSAASTLGASNISAIAYNGTEFLIGTAGGKLARYNGSTFTSCTTNFTNSTGGCFGAQDVRAITSIDGLWVIGGSGGRLCLYDSTAATPVDSDFTSLGQNSNSTTRTTLLASGWSTNGVNAICQNGDTILIGGDYSCLNKASGFYDGITKKAVVSNKVNSTYDRIYSVALNVTAVTNGQTMAYYVSCDGGTNWQSIKDDNNTTVVSNTGFDLRWKAEMTGAWKTPKLSAVNLNYITMDQTILPKGFGGDVLSATDVLSKVYVPLNTSSSDLRFSFIRNETPPVSTQVPTTAVLAYDITARNSSTGVAVSDFSKALTLTLHIESSGGIVTGTSITTNAASTSLAVAYWNGLHWIPLSTKVTFSGTDILLTAKISHLSKYGIVIASPTGIIASAEPNPFTPTSANTNFSKTKITFANPDQVSAEVKIWDRNGSLVRIYSVDGVGQTEWDGKDTQGTIVESGVYFYEAIVGGTSNARGTVVVGR